MYYDGGFSAGLNILHPNISTHMKRIYRFGPKGYVQMDTYPEDHDVHPINWQNFLMSLFVAGIATMTAAAIVGVDITNPNATPNHEAVRSPNR